MRSECTRRIISQPEHRSVELVICPGLDPGGAAQHHAVAYAEGMRDHVEAA